MSSGFEVGAAQVADKERVAGKYEPRCFVSARVLYKEGGVLGTVTGGGYGNNARLAHLDPIVVVEGLVLVLDARLLGDVDLCPGRLGESSPTGDMVGMVVRLQNVGDPKVMLVCKLKVLGDLPLGVYDRRLAVVGHDVRGATKVFVKYLPKKHRQLLVSP